MKRLPLISGALVTLLLVVLLSSCWLFGGQSWDGKINGDQIYSLTVTQNNRFLTFTATIDQAALQDLKDQMAADGMDYTAPTELFFWMSPKFKDGHASGYSSSDPTMYPVARRKIVEGQNTVTATVDLGQLANNGQANLQTGNFDGDVNFTPGDDMNGLIAYMSDGYAHNGYQDVKISWEDPVLGPGNQQAYFQDVYPAGTGVSNLVYYPDPNDTTEQWSAFVLAAEGVYVQRQSVEAGQQFDIWVQLPGGVTTLTNGVALTWYYNGNKSKNLTIGNANHDSEDQSKYVWHVTFGLGGDSPSMVYIDPSNVGTDTWIDVNYSYYYASFTYAGSFTKMLATDFDGDNVNTSGVFGVGANDLVRSSEDFTNQYSQLVVVDPNYTNWAIGQLSSEGGFAPPTGFSSGNNVLGTGSNSGSGADIEMNYDSNRNDFVTFPTHNFYADWQASPETQTARVAVKAREAFDSNYNDYAQIQIEWLNTNGTFSYWATVGWIDGPLEGWEIQTNNGWQEYSWNIDPSGWFSPYGSQRVRIVFHSDGYNNYPGVLIDDFQVSLVQ